MYASGRNRGKRIINKTKNLLMDKRDLFNRIEYLSTCISAFGEQFNLSNIESYNYLRRYKGVDFLIDCYDAEHTLSIENAVEDLQMICANNGGKLK